VLNPFWGDHNSLGYRGKEFPFKKPDGERRIVILGDSIIYQDNMKLSIPAALSEIINDFVINAGVGGYSIERHLNNFKGNDISKLSHSCIPS